MCKCMGGAGQMVCDPSKGDMGKGPTGILAMLSPV